METALRRVEGTGPAHAGTLHFWRQRLTGLANVPLVIAALVLIIALAGKPWTEVVLTLSRPWAALVLALLVISVATHMRLGMQVIIEDYIHGEGARFAAIIANIFYCGAVAAVALFAVAKLAFGFGV